MMNAAMNNIVTNLIAIMTLDPITTENVLMLAEAIRDRKEVDIRRNINKIEELTGNDDTILLHTTGIEFTLEFMKGVEKLETK